MWFSILKSASILYRFCTPTITPRLRSASFVCLILSGLALPLAAQPRVDVSLNSGWRFIRQDVSGAQNASFNDSAWSVVNLPHTWNGFDGQAGGSYYQGIGWYRTHYPVDGSQAGRRFFLKFDGAYSVADVWVNGNYLGQHQGGFAAFVFDVTPCLKVGADNVIAVKVNNAYNADVPTLGGDFTLCGGLYRNAHLLVTDPVQISPLDFGSPGVYLKTTNVSSNSADLQITTVVSNANATAKTVMLRATVFDAASNTVTVLTNTLVLAAGTLSNVVQSTTVANPHLWNGLADPYLYRVLVELVDGTSVIDQVSQPLGFRWFSVDPNTGFQLNGRAYDLHGVNLHQFWLNLGWAITSTERQKAYALLKELGATFVRLCHYQHADETYQLGDENGIVLWSELGMVGSYTASSNFYANAKQQLQEMIRQNYNHPAICFWSLYNEQGSAGFTNLLEQLNSVAHTEDSTRLTTAASNQGDGAAMNWYTDVISFNKYFGWYGGVNSDFSSWADNIHNNYPTRCIGLSEYGAGASVYQHEENPTAPVTTSAWHPEEWQNLLHEAYWPMLQARPWIWCKQVWVMFDFPSAWRNEGDTPGRNDKGLVTIDGQICKDAFYFYKAWWTTNPMVYITGHTFTNRLTNAITAKVYANCDSVELFLNGVSQGSRTSTNRIFTWPITLVPGGTNTMQAIGAQGTNTVADSLIWIGQITPPVVSITSPMNSMVYLNTTNDTLLLSATASNPPNSGPLTTTWSQLNGPGFVTFGNTNALTTTASFSANGTYTLGFTANNGTTASVGLTVVVSPNAGVQIQNGLLAWWKMDETGGGTAGDSSGNSRSATVSGAVFTTGYISNALHFNGSNNSASFASPDASQITVAAWVRADGQGNSAFPRILETPGYRVFFRFDASGSNILDFATFATGNGEWFTAQNSVGTGAWYHVAVSYDKTSLTNVPALYVNGVRLAPALFATPSGTTPSYSGTGYIGNRADLGRGWNGSIDDLRIYNRLLSDAEVGALALLAPPNLAPVVNAGASQTVIWPASANLNGSATDDGKPAPPGAVTVAWSKVSGPGTVTFANSNALTTTVTFSAVGGYQLQLAANDGQVTTVSSLNMTVALPPNISIQHLSSALQLSWPTGGGNWQLQYQSNSPATGLSTNWQNMPGTITNPFLVPISPSAGSVFYRLFFTNY
jgi:beta-galactosidase